MESVTQSSKEENNVCPYTLWDNCVVFNGKWIQARQVRFKTKNNGQEGVWQSVHRNTKPVGAPADGVSIIAKVTKNAGLIDNGETAEQAAIRELREETGYTCSKVISQSVECFLDPGLTDDSQCFVICEIDGDAKENQNPKQHLDSTEAIEVVLVEHSKLLDYLRNMDKSIAVEAGLYAYAYGAHFAKIFGK
ncbi:unnamed protein product [Caenorhabditis angaria]|uniref:Nudix hydrolase domain-containing protein n=1 Tax=Caenorhabditis angaria TaxID=860376 RepID=A0A9P1N5Z9_9PELO|nr:unnamed protein product [Caenorhabditis angaria]